MIIGASAATAASHVCLITALLLTFAAVQRKKAIPGAVQMVLESATVRLTAISVLVGFCTERSYYVAARLLRPIGVDLWLAHPTPEFLAIMLASTVFALRVALSHAVRHGLNVASPWWRRPLIEFVMVVALWFSIASSLG